MNLKHHCVLLLCIVHYSNSFNILSVLPYHGKSHFFVFKVLMDELANRGHNVTVISHFPQKNAPSNYHDISLAGSLKILEDEIRPVKRDYSTIFETITYLTSSGQENCEVMLHNKEVQRLVQSGQTFDLVLVEQFNTDCGFGLAYKLKSPVVGITSHILMPWHYQRLGIPHNHAFVPFHFTEGGTKPTLYQRLERTVLNAYFNLMYYISQRNDQKTISKYLGEVPYLEDLAREMKLLLLYHNFVLTGSRLFPQNVIEVGGYHVAPAKALTGDLKEFIKNAEHGVIYISFGSVVRSSSLPEDQLQAILDVIAELPQRFVWKWEADNLPVGRKNLYVAKWLPQSDILGHPKTLAFFSHSGMLGTTEAIHFGVPVVAMPILGDQPANAASVEESGLGVQIQVRDLNKDNLLKAFRTVLDPKFRTGVKELSRAWHDRPMSPMDTAVFWIEFAARHPNKSFRAAAADVPCYQYLNLDVLAVLSLPALAIVLLVISLCSSSTDKRSVKKTKKNKSKSE